MAHSKPKEGGTGIGLKDKVGFLFLFFFKVGVNSFPFLIWVGDHLTHRTLTGQERAAVGAGS